MHGKCMETADYMGDAKSPPLKGIKVIELGFVAVISNVNNHGGSPFQGAARMIGAANVPLQKRAVTHATNLT